MNEAEARSFYNNTDTSTSTPPVAPAASDDTQASKLFPSMGKDEPARVPEESIPENIRALRDADDARKLFPPGKTYEQSIGVKPEWPEENRAVAAEWSEIFADLELNTDDARDAVHLVNSLTEIPSEEERGGWWADSQRELSQTYGEHGAQGAIADARRLMERDPRVARALRETGLNAHPKVVMKFAEKARSLRNRGKL